MRDSLFITPIVLASLCLAACLGLSLHRVLPERHFKGDSGDAIKLATGLMATLIALVLSLLISSANNVRNTVGTEYIQSLTKVGLLNRYLANYGPETEDIRQFLRQAVSQRFQALWPNEQFGPAASLQSDTGNSIDTIEKYLLQLSPAGDAQAWFRSQALQAVAGLAESRWVVLNQTAGSTLPMPMLAVLVAWTAIIIVSFGLFAEPNATAYVSLFLCALAASVAVFLILELNSPFSGLFQFSSAPARALLAQLGR